MNIKNHLVIQVNIPQNKPFDDKYQKSHSILFKY